MIINKNKYKVLMENLPQKIFLKDKNSVYIFSNKNYARDLNIKSKEIAGKTDYDFYPKELAEKYRSDDKRIMKKGRIENIEERYIQNGKKLIVHTVKVPIKDKYNNVNGLLGIFWDITKEKEEEKRIKQKIKIKSDFTSMLSHEFRTSLTAIIESLAIVLEGSVGTISTEQREFLDITKRNVDRLITLINSTLDFHKLEAGKMEFNIQENNINEVIKEIQQSMAFLVKGKGLDFIIRMDNALPNIKFDKDKIIQVLINIVDNAVAFTEKGSITIITSRENNFIHIVVKDTGCGIKKKDMLKLFHKFKQTGNNRTGNNRTGNNSGTGLGLAISKEIIEKHNGKIWADSIPGKGTTFHFILPT